MMPDIAVWLHLASRDATILDEAFSLLSHYAETMGPRVRVFAYAVSELTDLPEIIRRADSCGLECRVRAVPNGAYDLNSLPEFLSEIREGGYSYAVKLHTKTDPVWRRLMFDSLRNLSEIVRSFELVPELGMVGSPLCSLSRRLNSNWNHHEIMLQVASQMQLEWPLPPFPEEPFGRQSYPVFAPYSRADLQLIWNNDYSYGHFVAGTCFAIRAQILRHQGLADFLSKLREQEGYPWIVERLFGVLTACAGYAAYPFAIDEALRSEDLVRDPSLKFPDLFYVYPPLKYVIGEVASSDYGNGDSWVDVTNEVVARLRERRCISRDTNFNLIVGDPRIGHSKVLRVRTHDGESVEAHELHGWLSHTLVARPPKIVADGAAPGEISCADFRGEK
ncbi:MAG: hypothetical protein ACYCOU_03830 [Sulfobacillus sp.]